MLDILTMYDALDRGFENLVDKSSIDVADLPFEGFDGNQDSEHSMCADQLAYQFKRLAIPRGLDSHRSGSLAMYRRMLSVWKRLREKPLLDKADILAILAAQRPPA